MKAVIPGSAHREDFKALLIDTSSYGIAFYVSYHRWVASAKEIFFVKNVPGFTELFTSKGIKLLILESHLKISREVRLHEDIRVYISCPILKKLKAHLNYVITNKDGDLVAEAENKIVFTDRNNSLAPIPDQVYKALQKISVKK